MTMINFFKKGKILPVAFLSLLVLVGLTIAYFNSQHERTLKLGFYSGSSWGVPNGNDYKVVDSAIARFEKSHPDVQVVYESGISKDDYSDWLTDQIVSGTQPDIFIVPENDFNLLSSTGALASLDKNITANIDSNIFYESAYNAGKYNNSQFALPFESNPMMMCINIDLLEKEGIAIPESGWTLADFYKICQQVTKDTDGDGVTDQYGYTGYDWQKAVAAYGVDLFNSSGTKAYFDTDRVREALNVMLQLQSLSGNYMVNSNDFDQGKVAFIPMTVAEYRTYQPYPYHVAKYSTFSWSCVPMPAGEAGGDATQVSTSLFAISSKTKQADLAWEFLQLLCIDEDTQQSLFDYSQGTSVLKSVMTSEETENKLKEDGFGSDSLTPITLDSMLSQGITNPTFKTYNTTMEQADYLISKAMANNSLDKDLFAIQKEVQDSLQ
ncbi:ABC transporter substrate-binding protein [Streptococcus henryi]|uniref:ABC transporter substrate-binding protein n=1 Tax=Streptococcus henryi TaxID=439219 RepID=UPI00037B8081|nr:sugar ABC transporter substrate-binding protein [Streptococcus henryi]